MEISGQYYSCFLYCIIWYIRDHLRFNLKEEDVQGHVTNRDVLHLMYTISRMIGRQNWNMTEEEHVAAMAHMLGITIVIKVYGHGSKGPQTYIFDQTYGHGKKKLILKLLDNHYTIFHVNQHYIPPRNDDFIDNMYQIHDINFDVNDLQLDRDLEVLASRKELIRKDAELAQRLSNDEVDSVSSQSL